MSTETPNQPGDPMSGLVASAVEYMVDAGQRSMLFLDVMRQRGGQYREHVAQTVPHVLQYATELIIDGRQLDEPVNYALVRIIPPIEIDPERRPFIVVDPRTATREVLSASGRITGERARRLQQIAALFGADAGEDRVAPFDPKARAS